MIPCHRVVGANGSLTGYAGGIDKKIQLLVHEGVNVGACLFHAGVRRRKHVPHFNRSQSGKNAQCVLLIESV